MSAMGAVGRYLCHDDGRRWPLLAMTTTLDPAENSKSRLKTWNFRDTQDLYRLPKGPSASEFFLVTIAASKDRRKAKRAADEGFEILIGPEKLTRFEKARIVGARSLQLAMGAPSFVPIDETITEPIALAMMELAADALPISIRRS